MSKEDIEDLESLDHTRLDERERLALTWIREAITSQEGAPEELKAAFLENFSSRERRCIIATMQIQFFMNLIFNTLLPKKNIK